MLEKIVIVRASRNSSDIIYVGRVREVGNCFLTLEKASNIFRYEEVGMVGLGARPDKVSKAKTSTTKEGIVYIPIGAIIDIIECEEIWREHLHINIGD